MRSLTYEYNDYRGIIACEENRLYYDEESEKCKESKCCPKCGCENPEYFYCDSADDCVGCSECVTVFEWSDF